MRIDQFQWTQHNDFFRLDFAFTNVSKSSHVTRFRTYTGNVWLFSVFYVLSFCFVYVFGIFSVELCHQDGRVS